MGIAAILRIISSLLTVYILFVVLRVLLFWFNGRYPGKVGDF